VRKASLWTEIKIWDIQGKKKERILKHKAVFGAILQTIFKAMQK